jgi:DNA-binding CsgD family transcriptional regulator
MPPGSLTPRERQVLCLVGEGLTSAQIGAALGIASRTVDRQAASAVARLGARSRRHAALMVSDPGGSHSQGLRADEREVLALLAGGSTLDETAAALHYSRRTVARRLARARLALRVSTTAQALTLVGAQAVS